MSAWLATNWHRTEAYLAGGGMVMWPLLLLSLVMWLLIINRVLYFRRLHRKYMTSEIAWEHVRSGCLPDARRFQDAVALLVSRFLQRRSADRRLNGFILDETVLAINRSLNAYLAVIGMLAAVAPLLGLLGTVMGMLATFDVLAVFGTGNARAMAGGISEALITTQTGLLVAIPGLYMKHFLERRAHTLKQRVATVGYHLRQRL